MSARSKTQTGKGAEVNDPIPIQGGAPGRARAGTGRPGRTRAEPGQVLADPDRFGQVYADPGGTRQVLADPDRSGQDPDRLLQTRAESGKPFGTGVFQPDIANTGASADDPEKLKGRYTR